MSSKIKKILVWTMIGAGCMLNNYGHTQEWKYDQYVSKIAGLDISMDYISGWTYQETRGERGSFAHVIFIENSKGGEVKAFMSVTATPVQESGPKEINLSSSAEEIVKKRSQFKEFKVLSNAPTTLAGNKAQEIILSYQTLNKLYSIDSKLIPVKERIVLLGKGAVLYSLNYQGPADKFDTFNEAFTHCITTLQFKEKQEK